MNNNNHSICQHYCLLLRNHCCCCSCSISIEEILTWIIICSLIFLFYNTIKLCIIIFLIISIIYWIYKQTEILRLFKEFYQKQINLWRNSKTSIDELIQDNHINRDDDTQELNTLTAENDNVQYSLSTKTLSNSDFDINTISNSDFTKANNCDDIIMKSIKTSKKNLNEKKNSHQSTTKKLLIDNTQDQYEFSPDNSEFNISQSDYYGPIHTIMNNVIVNKGNQEKLPETLNTTNQIEHKFKEKMIIEPQISVDTSKTLIVPDILILNEIQNENKILVNIIKQTKDIRQTIETLHEDILQLKTNSNEKIIDNISNLSLEEQTILKLATENLIQIIMSNRIDKKSNIPPKQFKKYSSNELVNPIKYNKNQESCLSTFDDDIPQSEETSYTHTDMKSKQFSTTAVTSNETDNSMKTQLQYPKCIPVQTSFAMNSIIPRVSTKANVITIDDNDKEDKKSNDDYIKTSQHIITTNEQFENIISKDDRKLEDLLLLKQDSIRYNNEQLDWAYYSSKPDPFANVIHTNLPIIQSENQHSSFKPTFLSHFYHHPKYTSTSIPATLHSSSLNALNNISTIKSHYNKLNLQNNINTSDYIKSFESSLTAEQQSIAKKLFNDKVSFNYIWNKTLNHLKQRIFRVRKSRIIISFDNIQQQEDADDNDKNHLNTLVNTFVHDMPTEINDTHSQLIVNNEQSTKIRKSSIVSLYQSSDSAIQEGQLLIHDDRSIYQDSSENEDSLSEISNSLYSVTSQLILT